jgi:hypothetical protein
VRRTGGYIALVLGFFLIFLAPLLKWYAVPRVEKAPTDTYDTSVSNGFGRYFSVKTVSVTPVVPMQNVSVAKGDPSRSTHTVAVIHLFQRTTDLQNRLDIDYSTDVYAFDRASGYAVHCCGEKPRHEGVTLKFPFGADKDTRYPFYDSTAHKAFPARYMRTETVDGLKTYVFQSDVPDTSLGTLALPGVLADQPDKPSVTTDRHYRAQTTTWVEPVTGAIVKGSQHAAQWATYQGRFVTPLSDTNFTNSPKTVKTTADRIVTKYNQLRLVDFYLQVFGPVLGIILIVLGLLLLPRPRAAQTVEPSEQTAAAV